MNKTKLDIYKNENTLLNDAFDQAVMNIHIQKEQNGYTSFVICGCEAGDGTTTVAINLAAALASSGRKTVLVDGDMRKKVIYKHLSDKTDLGLSNYLTADTKLEDIIYETTTENLSYIPCGMLIDNPIRLLCSQKMDTAKKELEEKFEYVVFDMPAINAAMDAKVMAVKADATIIVSSMGDTTKKGLLYAVNSLVETKANLIGTIINRTDLDEYRRYRKDYDYFNEEKYATASKKQKKRNKKNG